ncbi:PrsW family intramembrane metalloprotease [Variovorax sp. OV329]|uniref:PrsW family intramembrane metalloprotease n=1 Tax=Variovorax sp. OV329 TaxID=1882825 RepID=UPI0008E1564B|nr:PrsW family intramembrane metalloprotease [Variovorax sp. OV329]SFL88047.1 Membrane proteinase PrsW, cleaves anti-sigma factor RsiW, M82 family [Variovorax sp. OV329]
MSGAAPSAAATSQEWPIGLDSFFQPRRAAFWLLVFLLVMGAVSVVKMFAIGYRVVPLTLLSGVVLWALYTLPFLMLFHLLDLDEEHPPLGFVMAFAWGSLAAVYLALPSNSAILGLCAKLVSPTFAAEWGAAVAGPVTEEFLKLIGVVLIMQIARNQFRTPHSVLILGALSGLGFQVVENLSYTVNSAVSFPTDSQLMPVAHNFVMRGLLNGLWSHAAYTTVAAFGVVCFKFRRDLAMPLRVLLAAQYFLLAWALHFVWNSPLINDWIPGNGFASMVVLTLVKGLPAVIAVWLIWGVASRVESRHLQALAAYYVPERELIRDDERRRLGAPLRRLAVRRKLAQRYGRRAGRLKGRLQREQLRLVLRAGEKGRGAHTRRLEHRILLLRKELDWLCEPPRPEA